MSEDKSRRGPASSGRSPSALEVYYGLLEVLRRAGVREPGGSVSCQRVSGANPAFLIATESYMAPRVQTVLSKVLSRQVYFASRGRLVLSPEEASRIAAYAETPPENGR